MSNKKQVQINRLLEAMEMIADMPVVDPALKLTFNQVAAQYDEAREMARLAVEQFNRSEAEGGDQRSEIGAALREGINGLHARRGELVMQAKALRKSGDHAGRAAVWENIHEITVQIEQAEADLAATREVRHG